MKIGDRPGVRRVRRAAERGQRKYAGSWAEDLWRRLDSMDFINRGMLFAATLLLCLFPFLIVLSALAGRPVVNTLARYTGLNGQAAADAGHLFASSAATANAVVGTTSMVFFVLGGIAAAAALQEIYEQVFELPHRGMADVPHRLAWLAVLIGTSLLTGWTGPWLHHAGGAALLAVAGLVWSTGFWWLTMRILLAGRISWRNLFPAACATGVLYVAMETVFSLFFSGMVISNDNKYGPIGFIFALLSYLTAIGVVVILGAVAGLAWYERSSGKSTGHLPLPSGNCGRLGDGRHEYAARPRERAGRVGQGHHQMVFEPHWPVDAAAGADGMPLPGTDRVPAGAWHMEARCRTRGDHVEIEACSCSSHPPPCSSEIACASCPSS
jgi:membrane protein